MARRRVEKNPVVVAIKRVGMVRLLAVLALSLAGAYFSFALAISGVARFKQPAIALKFVPAESEALAMQADLLSEANLEHPPAAVRPMATEALEAQALNPRALRLLAIAETNRGDVQHARRLADLASRLSRREPGTQLWLINRAARDGNLALALFHIDVVMRTKPTAQSALYPILLRGLVDPGFRKLLQAYMRKDDDPWVADFVAYAITNAADLSPLISLAEEGEGGTRANLTVEQARLLMGRLDKAGRYAALQRVYILMPGAKAFRVRNPQFDTTDLDEQFGVAGWQVFDGPDAGASFVSRGKDAAPAMSLYVNAATSRTVASKLLYLDPGSYTLTTDIADIDRGQGGGLSWQLRCPTRTAGGTAWTSAVVGNQSAMTLTVPEDCRVQFLDLVANGGQGQSGLDATISSVTLVPFGRTADS